MKSIIFLFLTTSLNLFALTLGIIDSEYVFNHYSKRITLEQELEKKRSTLNAEIEVFRQELLKKEKEILSKSQISKKDQILLSDLKKQFQSKIDISKKEFESEQSIFVQEIKFEIDSVATLIGQQKKLDIVVEKNMTIYGGIDISEDVLTFLNTTESFELKNAKYLEYDLNYYN